MVRKCVCAFPTMLTAIGARLPSIRTKAEGHPEGAARGHTAFGGQENVRGCHGWPPRRASKAVNNTRPCQGSMTALQAVVSSIRDGCELRNVRSTSRPEDAQELLSKVIFLGLVAILPHN